MTTSSSRRLLQVGGGTVRFFREGLSSFKIIFTFSSFYNEMNSYNFFTLICFDSPRSFFFQFKFQQYHDADHRDGQSRARLVYYAD